MMFVGMMIILVGTSCRKTENWSGQSPIGTKTAIVGPNQGSLLKQQLRWIARGIPDLADTDHQFRNVVEFICNQRPGEYYASNGIIQQEALGQLSIDYEAEVYANVNTRFPSNSYDRDFFFEVDINGCLHIVGIKIPELDIIDTTKKLVVMPEDPYTNGGDSIYGYFVNDTIPLVPPILDSVLITEDNMDSLYLWVVGLVQDCLDSNVSGGAFEGVRWFCDGDGICEPEQGETEENCQDCYGSYRANKKLVLKEVRSLTDRKKYSSIHPDAKYQEAHLQGKYEIGYTYAVVENSTLQVKNLREPKGVAIGVTYIPPQLDFKAWGRNAEIKRCRKNRRGKTRCNRGSETTKTWNDVMSYDYDKNLDAIYFFVFERDMTRVVGTKKITMSNSNGTITNDLILTQQSAPGKPYSYTWNTRTGQMEYIFEVLPGSTTYQWVPDPSGNGTETMTLNFDGEVQFILALE